MPPEPETTDLPRRYRNWHRFEFPVHGTTFEEIDAKAKVLCDEYFGDNRYRFDVESHAKMHNGEVIEVHANVTARYILSREEQQAHYQDSDF